MCCFTVTLFWLGFELQKNTHRHWKHKLCYHALLHSDALFRKHSLYRIPVVRGRKMLVQRKTQISKFKASPRLTLSMDRATSAERPPPDHPTSPCDSSGKFVLCLATALCQSWSSLKSNSELCVLVDLADGYGPVSPSLFLSVIYDLSIGEHMYTHTDNHVYIDMQRYTYRCTYKWAVYVSIFTCIKYMSPSVKLPIILQVLSGKNTCQPTRVNFWSCFHASPSFVGWLIWSLPDWQLKIRSK